MLSSDQLNQLLETINTNQAIFFGSELGTEFLSEYDKALLEANGVDWQTLYNPSSDSIYTSFHLGMLATALNDVRALNKLTFKDLSDYIKQGQYIPVTEREIVTIQAIKTQTFTDIRSLNGRIFQDINGILINSNLESQREFLREQIAEGVSNKKTYREISNTISEKLGDWSRDFDRIVEYQANSAYQEGRASMFEKDELGESGDNDPEVYKIVFQSACKHCLSLYTTKGYQSEPIVFKLSELRANGTNIGRKVVDWKPTIGSTHPYCRCLLMRKRKGYKWNQQTQSFDIRETTEEVPKRLPIRVKISGREILV